MNTQIYKMEILGVIDLPLWLLGLLTFVVSVGIYTRYKQTLFARHGIRQKPTTFLVGEFVAFAKKGIGYFNLDLVKDYGNVFGIYLGNLPMLMIADTEIIKQILVKDFSKFTDRFDMMKGKKKKSIWSSAVTRAYGDHWKFIRSTLSPTFSSGKMRHMSPYIHKCLDNFLEILAEKLPEQGDGFDISPIFRGYTMDVICSTGFGMDVNSQREPNNPFIEHAKLILEANPFKNPFAFLILVFPELIKLMPASHDAFISKKATEFFQSATEAALEERKKDASKHRDILQLMMNASKAEDEDEETDTSKEEMTFTDYKKRGLTNDEILANSIIFMIAGYETTATTLVWLTYDLMVNPEVQEKLIAEIDQEIGQDQANYDNAFRLKYLDMVVNETLRMHPPGVVISRTPNEDVEINGLKLKKGWSINIPVLALHYMTEYWEEPMKYMPERFAPENQANINQYAYLPFGVGPRNCVGMRLALLEVKMTLISLLQKYRVVKSSKLKVPMPPGKRGIYKPAEPIYVTLEPRNKSE